MARFEVFYPGMQGPVEEGKDRPSIQYETDERGHVNIPTPIDVLAAREVRDILAVHWGRLEKVSVNRPDGEQITDYGNFVNFRDPKNREVIFSQLGSSHPVEMHLIEDGEEVLVGARLTPPKPQMSASVELVAPNSSR
ncbi:MAG TPA: hypothetical protein VHE53_05335 [Patescibacteria group bacterium]|nr:hypothetical protein [Patescibacteria group bacterium]